jgi:hypothetical protein
LEFRVQGSGFRVQGSGFRVQGSGFRVEAQRLGWDIDVRTSPTVPRLDDLEADVATITMTKKPFNPEL